MNIKRCTSLFLAFLLLVSNVGMAFNVHYCSDKITSVSLNSSAYSLNSEKDCCKKIASKKDSCCKNKFLNFQKKSDNAIVKTFSFEPHFSFLIQEVQPIVYSSNANFKSSSITSYFCDANAPPFFKLYHQYIFYA